MKLFKKLFTRESLAGGFCPTCGESLPEPPSKGKGGRQRVYCGQSCRKKAERRRKKEARPETVASVEATAPINRDELESIIERLEALEIEQEELVIEQKRIKRGLEYVVERL